MTVAITALPRGANPFNDSGTGLGELLIRGQNVWEDYWDNGLVGTALYYLPHPEAMPERSGAALSAIVSADYMETVRLGDLRAATASRNNSDLAGSLTGGPVPPPAP
jgi:hypothetical protein